MRLNEDISRIKEIMGLITEQTAPFYTKEGNFSSGGPIQRPLGSVDANLVFPNIKNGQYPKKIDPALVSKTFGQKLQVDQWLTGKIPGASQQVNDQLEYLKKNKLLGDQKFTILDDLRSEIYLFNPGYSFVKSYLVLTGEHLKNDELVINDFYVQVYNKFKETIPTLKKEGLGAFIKKMKDCIYGGEFKSEEWQASRATPAGFFRRTAGFKDRLEDQIARMSDEAVYGKKYLSFETLDGVEMATAFHGTQLAPRLAALNKADITPENCRRRKISKGCVNFKEPDIFEIEKFIGPHQYSIWLPSDGKNIITIGNNPNQIPPDLNNPSIKKRIHRGFERIV